jgi:hypothetical protein
MLSYYVASADRQQVRNLKIGRAREFVRIAPDDRPNGRLNRRKPHSMREKYYAFMALAAASFFLFGVFLMASGRWSTPFVPVLLFLPWAALWPTPSA